MFGRAAMGEPVAGVELLRVIPKPDAAKGQVTFNGSPPIFS